MCKVDKTVNKLIHDSGCSIITQAEILQEIKHFIQVYILVMINP